MPIRCGAMEGHRQWIAPHGQQLASLDGLSVQGGRGYGEEALEFRQVLDFARARRVHVLKRANETEVLGKAGILGVVAFDRYFSRRAILGQVQRARDASRTSEELRALMPPDRLGVQKVEA